MEDKEQQNLIQEQHNQTLMAVDTRLAELKERTDPKYLDKLMDDKMSEWLRDWSFKKCDPSPGNWRGTFSV